MFALRLPAGQPEILVRFPSIPVVFGHFVHFLSSAVKSVIECIRCNEHSDWVDVIILTNQ